MAHYDFQDRELTPLERLLVDIFHRYLEQPLIVVMKGCISVVEWITVKADRWL